MKWLRALLWIVPPAIWLYLVVQAWEVAQPEAVTNARFQYGQNELAPEWMPKSWLRSFLKEINLEVTESLFARDLKEVANSLMISPWVKRVGYMRRSYSGDMKMALEIRKPVCLLRRGSQQRYLDDELTELQLMNLVDPEKLNHETLPVVDVQNLENIPTKQKTQYLAELVGFLKQWNQRDLVATRLALNQILLDPYKGGGECRLKVMVRDLKFGSEVLLDWGVHRDYNELEDRRSEEKWRDLESAISQERPFSALDLRYKKPDIRF
jgi:hypothetical protein